MLWICLHFSNFSLQIALRGGHVSTPLIIASGGRSPSVVSCNESATQRGIRPGMSVSSALALSPELIEHLRDERAETQALANLAAWAGQFTPQISTQATDSLLLEVEGCVKLFGGLRALNTRMQEQINALGYHAKIACAPTPTAAWLFARAGITTSILERHELKRALAPLPLGLLAQSSSTAEKLTSMGVRTIGECLKLPRDGLGRRFGQGLLDELDRALGKLPDPRAPVIAPVSYRGRLLLPVPVASTEAILFALKRLVIELTGFLLRRGAGVTRLKLDLLHEDRPCTSLFIGLSVPSREVTRILQLLRERLSGTTLVDRVEALELEATEITSLTGRNLTLFPDDQGQKEERLILIEHLRARLGTESIHGVTTAPDHRPEYAYRRSEPGVSSPPVHFNLDQRPLWLLSEPRPLKCENEKPLLDGPLILAAGPERIESGWWDGHDVRRDYFIARNNVGELLWIFRSHGNNRGWYVHGLFG